MCHPLACNAAAFIAFHYKICGAGPDGGGDGGDGGDGGEEGDAGVEA